MELFGALFLEHRQKKVKANIGALQLFWKPFTYFADENPRWTGPHAGGKKPWAFPSKLKYPYDFFHNFLYFSTGSYSRRGNVKFL